MEKKERQTIIDLLNRYREGRCTARERQLVDSWYNGLEGGEEDYLTINKVMGLYAEEKYRQTLPGLQPAPALATGGRTVALPRKRLYRWAAAAAVTGFVLWGGASQLSRHSKSAPVVAITETSARQVKNITLPDGSRVWLNRASRMEWRSDPDNKQRRVVLSGEARFDVAHDPERPFIVQTGGTETRVLGTEFNIEAYPGEQEIKVALLSGRVAFTDKQDSSASLLMPGNMMRYRKKDGLRLVGSTNSRLNDWLKGAVSFNEVPVKDAVERIALFNNYSIAWETDKLPQGTISAVFYKETPDQMLASLAFSGRFRYKIRDHSITIY